MLKKYLSLKIFFIFFIILFWIVSLFFLYNLYQNELKRFRIETFPTIEGGGKVSMTNINRNISLDSGKSGKSILSLSPGQTYKGEVVVKNHSESSNFTIKKEIFKKVEDKSSEQKEQPTIIPLISYLEDEIYIDKGDIAYVEYEVFVPKNTPEGNYLGLLQAYPIKLDTEPAMKVILAAGVKIELEVTNSPKNYTYGDIFSNPYLLAKQSLFHYSKIITAIFFSLLSLSFIIYYFRKK